jgi:hypothetical protein
VPEILFPRRLCDPVEISLEMQCGWIERSRIGQKSPDGFGPWAVGRRDALPERFRTAIRGLAK